MKCNNCGKENPAGTRFCGDCGQPLTVSQPVQTITPEPDTSGNAPSARPTESAKPRNTIYLWGHGVPYIVALVLMICICLVCAAMAIPFALLSTPTPSAEVRDIPVPTSKVTTAVFIPSTTPIRLPSATDTLIRAIAPATSSPTSSPESAYVQWAESAGKVLSGAFQVLGENLTQAGKNPALLYDATWREDTASFMVLIKRTDAEIMGKQPPRLFASVHADFASAASHYDKAMDYLATALDKHDASKLSQSNQEIKTGNDLMNRATQKLKQIKVP